MNKKPVCVLWQQLVIASRSHCAQSGRTCLVLSVHSDGLRGRAERGCDCDGCALGFSDLINLIVPVFGWLQMIIEETFFQSGFPF
jgi:hypothetical protein